MLIHADNSEPCVVYAAMNLMSRELYIGATRTGLRNRQVRHIWNANNGHKGKFYDAIRQYGENNFWFYTLAPCDSFDEALKEEMIFIKALKPEYNLTEGGGGVKGLKFSAESKKRMSDARKGRPGHKLSAEAREKIRQSRLGKKITDPIELDRIRRIQMIAVASIRKKVICINDNKEFSSITEAANYYGLTHRTVSEYCRGRKSRKGLSFKYGDIKNV